MDAVNWNQGVAITCLVGLAGALWRVIVWLGTRADKYLDHRMACDAKLVEHVGEIATAIQDRVPAGAIAEIHAAVVRPK